MIINVSRNLIRRTSRKQLQRKEQRMNTISGATVTLSLEEFDRLREAADEREAEGLKNRSASCISADFKKFNEKLEKIDRNLIEPFKAEFEQGNISIDTASEIASLVAQAQQVLYKIYQETIGALRQQAAAYKEMYEIFLNKRLE